jgi:hypothetical protein
MRAGRHNLDDKGQIVGERVLARKDGDNYEVPPEEIHYRTSPRSRSSASRPR